MFTLFKRGPDNLSPRFMGGGLLFNGLLCVFFGLAILVAPELLNYLVAIFFIVVGASLLSMWWGMRR
jgi:uncharacterized membrane protein HdeD (DUF308 family)